MKTVFKKGMEVYDQVFFPDTNGKIVEIHNRNGKIQLEVKFFSRHRLEPLCMQSSFFYDEKGNMTSAWDRTCETPTLSTKPYKVEFQGFEQKAPIPTFEHALDWVISTIKDNYFIELDKQLKALNKLIILRDYYNEGWQPDWKSDNKKYIIERYEDELRVIGIFGTGAILHFRKLNIAERFLEEQKELLEIAKPLL